MRRPPLQHRDEPPGAAFAEFSARFGRGYSLRFRSTRRGNAANVQTTRQTPADANCLHGRTAIAPCFQLSAQPRPRPAATPFGKPPHASRLGRAHLRRPNRDAAGLRAFDVRYAADSSAITDPTGGPSWVTGGKAHAEHKTSGLPLIATDARTSSIGGFGPIPDVISTALPDHRHRLFVQSGAPRSTKTGTTRSPLPYDAAACHPFHRQSCDTLRVCTTPCGRAVMPRVIRGRGDSR